MSSGLVLMTTSHAAVMLPFRLLRYLNAATRPQISRLQRLPLDSLRSRVPSTARLNSTRVPPILDPGLAPSSDTQAARSDGDEPRLSLTFTCTAGTCTTRSTHQFTKRAYEKGIVLIECPGCKIRYVSHANAAVIHHKSATFLTIPQTPDS